MLDSREQYPRDWRLQRLSNVADFQNGHAFYKDGYSNEGLLAIDLYNIDEDGRLRFGERDKRVSFVLSERYSKFKLNRDDLVIVMTDMTQRMGILGKCAIIDHNNCYILNQRVGRIVAKRDVVLTKYLYYFINSELFLKPLRALAKGAVQKYVNTGDIKENLVALPPLPIQCRLAGILSAYDDLIENNLRRIRILEEMASALYREWFVHFRFPGHETVPRVTSPLGSIPNGWEVVAFTDIADVLSGGTPKTDIDEFWDGDIPFFTPRDAPACFYVQDTDKHISELGLSKCASELYPPDTVFITARGTVGKVALPSVPMAMNQSCYALRGKSGIQQCFLFLMTLQQVDYLKKNTGGSTFDTIVVDTFRRMQVVKPPIDLVASFSRQTNAMFEAVNTLQRQTTNLRQTRDLLLPRLLSGQLPLAIVTATPTENVA